MTIDILEPCGYCAGVERAVQLGLKAKNDNPNMEVYVLGMLVHNHETINMLSSKGIKTLNTNESDAVTLIKDLPTNSILIFTAHGHDKMLDEIANDRGITCIDAVCPKVESNLNKIKAALKDNKTVIYIGESEHPETKSALSISNKILLYTNNLLNNYYKKDESFYVINQTTLNYKEIKTTHDAIKKAFPNAVIEDEICPTTRLRQESIISLNKDVDILFIVGSKESSNTKRLLELANKYHPLIETHLIDTKNDIDVSWLINKKHAAIASGASTPKQTVYDIKGYLNNLR